jgi:hypothetical protein
MDQGSENSLREAADWVHCAYMATSDLELLYTIIPAWPIIEYVVQNAHNVLAVR